jgi:hypothetical protein
MTYRMKKIFEKTIGTIETLLIITGFMLGILYLYIEYIVTKPFTNKTRKLEY